MFDFNDGMTNGWDATSSQVTRVGNDFTVLLVSDGDDDDLGLKTTDSEKLKCFISPIETSFINIGADGAIDLW